MTYFPFNILIATVLAITPLVSSSSQFMRIRHNLSDMINIVGGLRVPISEFPYLVSIQRNGVHVCGGSLFRPEWILTAAHCMHSMKEQNRPPYDPRIFTVIAGLDEVTDVPAGSPKRREVYTFYAHEKFDRYLITHDIAMIRLYREFELGDTIHLTRLPAVNTMDKDLPTTCDVVGWGSRKQIIDARSSQKTPPNTNNQRKISEEVTLGADSNTVSNVTLDDEKKHNKGNGTKESLDELMLRATHVPLLYGVTVHIFSTQVCRNMFRMQMINEHMQICAGDAESPHDSCIGDSGGPLECHGLQMGIVSYGSGCADTRRPAVYTRVDYFIHWIEKLVAAHMNDSIPTVLKSGAASLRAWSVVYTLLFILV